MAKKTKGSTDAAQIAAETKATVDPAVEVPTDGPIYPGPLPVISERCSMLFELYVARIANADTLHTIRRDHRAIFADAFKEAQEALSVFNENMKTEGGSNE